MTYADKLNSVALDVANLTAVANAAGWQPINVTQLIALRIIVILRRRMADNDPTPVTLTEVTRSTKLPAGSVFRILHMQVERHLPLLGALAMGTVKAMTARGAAELLKPTQINAALKAENPDAELQRLLTNAHPKWKRELGGSNLPESDAD